MLSTLADRFHLRCVARVVDDAGRVHGAEWDHFNNRERRTFSEVWLVCRLCHLRMADWTLFDAAFEAC